VQKVVQKRIAIKNDGRRCVTKNNSMGSIVGVPFEFFQAKKFENTC
jgi:hypothetical protein